MTAATENGARNLVSGAVARGPERQGTVVRVPIADRSSDSGSATGPPSRAVAQWLDDPVSPSPLRVSSGFAPDSLPVGTRRR